MSVRGLDRNKTLFRPLFCLIRPGILSLSLSLNRMSIVSTSLPSLFSIFAGLSDEDRACWAAKMCYMLPVRLPGREIRWFPLNRPDSMFSLIHGARDVILIRHSVTEEGTTQADSHDLCDVYREPPGPRRFVTILSRIARVVLNEGLVQHAVKTAREIVPSPPCSPPILPSLSCVMSTLFVMLDCDEGAQVKEEGKVSLGELGYLTLRADMCVVFHRTPSEETRKVMLQFPTSSVYDARTLLFDNWRSFDHVLLWFYFQLIQVCSPPGTHYPQGATQEDKHLQWLQYQSCRTHPGTSRRAYCNSQ